MNKVILMGRLTRDPETRYSQGENPIAVARYTLAVDRRFRRGEGEETEADFLRCVAFGKSAEFAEKYFHQGLKVVVVGRIQTGSYLNSEGQKIHTVDIIIESQEFAESKAASEGRMGNAGGGSPFGAGNLTDENGFMNLPDGIDEELPFN